MWTHFWDMHSGGGLKEKWGHIYIEAPEAEAKVVFYNRFGHNPDRVSCTCCGEDYSVSESPTLGEATAYQRNCRYAFKDAEGNEVSQDEVWKSGKGLLPGCWAGYVEDSNGLGYSAYRPLAEYVADDNVLIIRADEIQPEERIGDVPEQGYVWK